MKIFFYSGAEWLEQPHAQRDEPFHASSHQQIDLSSSSLNTGDAIGINPKEAGIRHIASRLRSDIAEDYNQALALYSKLKAGQRGFTFCFLTNALPLAECDFPCGWRSGIDQFYLSNDLPSHPRLLVCFTGRAKALNMPIPCFHATAIRHFDGIAYFYDHNDDFYIKREGLVIKAFLKLLDIAPWENIATLGTSAGGTMALRISPTLFRGRRLAASPPILRDLKLKKKLEDTKSRWLKRARIFYAKTNAMDRHHYEYLRKLLPESQFKRRVFDLSQASNSHGTLATLMQLGSLDQNLCWLAKKKPEERTHNSAITRQTTDQ